MDNEKTLNERIKDQCYYCGKLFAVLSDRLEHGANSAEERNAQLFPLVGVTLMITKVHNLHKSDPDLERVLCDLFGHISADDWIEWTGGKTKAVPLDCQFEWSRGYWHLHGNNSETRVASMLSLRRREKRLTQKELAKKIGASQKDVSRWETGVYKPSAEAAKMLADALDCPIDDFI